MSNKRLPADVTDDDLRGDLTVEQAEALLNDLHLVWDAFVDLLKEGDSR